MARLLSTAFLVALLAATAWAFALTQGAKRELSPIHRTKIEPKLFSPECNCRKRAVTIDFRLRKRDRVSVWVERDGKRVQTLVAGRSYAAGPVALVFEGVSEQGTTLPDGVYRPVVHLDRQHRTIRLPDEIVLDTKRPVIRVRRRIYTHISPDGDGHNDVFRIPYRVSKAAHGILIVDGRQVERKLFRRTEGVLRWSGMLNGRSVPPGNHVLRISAEDGAGNRATPIPFAVVRVRYVELGRDRVIARPGTHFAILVLADAPTVSWRFAGGRGVARTRNGRTTLRLRAPVKPTVYNLFVTAAGHSDRAAVVVG